MAEGFRNNRAAVRRNHERLGEDGAELFALAAAEGVRDAVKIRCANCHALGTGVVQKREQFLGDGQAGGGGLNAQGVVA